MKRTFSAMLVTSCLFVVACNVNLPFDPGRPSAVISDVIDDVQDAVTVAVKDPLNAKPFPVLIGGDSNRVFYATTLTDIRLNFPGPTNDIVIPGFFGPSNVYRYENKRRELVRALVPAGTFAGMATDGRYVAFIRIADVDSDDGTSITVEVIDLSSLSGEVLFEGSTTEGRVVILTKLAASEGRVAYVVQDIDTLIDFIRIEDLTGIEPTIEIESNNVGQLALSGDRLVYTEESEDGYVRVLLRDLDTDEVVILSDNIRTDWLWPIRVFLTANSVVWSEPTLEDTRRILVYDIPSDTVRVWAEDVEGVLAGATDTYFVTELEIIRTTSRDRIAVWRYDLDGKSKKLAEFRADGLAGQVAVAGDRAVWVNPERRIVIAPLAGGDRQIFKPF
jgi:hypothetical protein